MHALEVEYGIVVVGTVVVGKVVVGMVDTVVVGAVAERILAVASPQLLADCETVAKKIL